MERRLGEFLEEVLPLQVLKTRQPVAASREAVVPTPVLEVLR